MGKILLFVFVVGFVAGCTQQIYLNKTPSDLMLSSIKPETNKKVSYSFLSQLSDTFVTKDFKSDVNATYSSYLDGYMHAKYNVGEKDSIAIKISLMSCNQTAQSVMPALQNDSSHSGAKVAGNRYIQPIIVITTEFNLRVVVNKRNQVLSEKTFFVTDEYRGDSYSASEVSSGFIQAINKSILTIDQFLSTVEF